MNSQRNMPTGLIALKSIMEGTSDYTGHDFFKSLVKNLAQVLDVHGVWITEYLKETQELNALAFWLDGEFVDEYRYKIENTPCEPVINSRNICHIPDRVIELFPRDKDLEKLKAVSYMGIAITDTDNEVMGHLAILDNKPMDEIPEAHTIFKIFSARATGEMRRIKVTSLLEENEKKLKRVFNGAQEAIIEFDEVGNIVQINSSGLKLLNAKLKDVLGTTVDTLFDKEGNDKLNTTIKSLEIEMDKWHSRWIQGYMHCVMHNNEKVPTETSISKYNVGGKFFYALFLHSVKEKLEVQDKLEKVTIEASMLKEQTELLNSSNILGESKSIQTVNKLISQVALTETTVLITGETGTGKELVAKAVHHASLRKDKPLITLNCAALPAELIESELFGHLKGAFTSAVNSRDGRFLLANNGTIFLDEIGELPIALQSKLLRVLQQGEFEPLGSSKTISVNVRVIAATNRNLMEEVKNGNFREDLYYRLNVFPIHIPPLREREKDVIIISEVFLNKTSYRNRIKYFGLDKFDQEKLISYNWPGNVRELQNVLERALILSKNGKLDLSYLLNTVTPDSKSIENATEHKVYDEEQMRLLEKQNIINALVKTEWKIAGKNGAAHLLGIPTTTLNSRIKKYDIVKK